RQRRARRVRGAAGRLDHRRGRRRARPERGRPGHRDRQGLGRDHRHRRLRTTKRSLLQLIPAPADNAAKRSVGGRGMSEVEATRAGARSETTGTGYKAVYWLLGLILIGYAIALVVRANGAGTTWIDGWGVAAYELLVSVLVLVRAAVSPRDRNFCLWLGA